MSERDLSRMGVTDSKNVGPLIPNNHLSNSKSVPALHHHTGSGIICKSKLTHLLILTIEYKIHYFTKFSNNDYIYIIYRHYNV